MADSRSDQAGEASVDPERERRPIGLRVAVVAGRTLQAVALGVLLYIAVLKLSDAGSAAQVFRYEGF